MSLAGTVRRLTVIDWLASPLLVIYVVTEVVLGMGKKKELQGYEK